MNSYLEMTMVKKEQGQDDCFSQQTILLTITSLYISPLIISSTYYASVGGAPEAYGSRFVCVCVCVYLSVCL